MEKFYKLVSKNDLNAIRDEIASIEKHTSGEIRVCFKLKRGLAVRKKTPRELALLEFHKLKMHKTADKTGVLVFILFKERKFEIVADEGINSKIKQEKWDEISAEMCRYFAEGNYREGVIHCLKEVGKVLAADFPIKPGDVNELSNEVVVD
ncbi:MAG: TPM domain-containing protein [Ignavibacteria bacterium]|nr:TPM domain-containing protein [Ignavibacteria bacterium]